MLRISLIIISGVIISCLTVLSIGFSALGEGSSPDYKWLWWFVLWLVGFSLHFKWRKIGYVTMLLPIIFHMILFVNVINH